MSKFVYKYGTGQEVPEGAVYLCTKTETTEERETAETFKTQTTTKMNTFVWHYFLVEVPSVPCSCKRGLSGCAKHMEDNKRLGLIK